MTRDYRWPLCCFMACLAAVLIARTRGPEVAPVTITVSVTDTRQVRPVLQALRLPELEVRR